MLRNKINFSYATLSLGLLILFACSKDLEEEVPLNALEKTKTSNMEFRVNENDKPDIH